MTSVITWSDKSHYPSRLPDGTVTCMARAFTMSLTTGSLAADTTSTVGRDGG